MTKEIQNLSSVTSLDADSRIVVDYTAYRGTSNNPVAISVQNFFPFVTPEMYGAVGDGVADDTVAIQAAINTGKVVYLTPSKTYKITQSIIGVSGSGFTCIGGMGKIYMPSASFNNVDVVGGKFGTNAVGLNFSGGLVSPFTPLEDVLIENVEIYTDDQAGKCNRAILVRNIKNCKVRNNEIRNFAVGVGICVNSLTGIVDISNNYIHDFYDNNTFWSSAQITGIEIDNDRVNSVNTNYQTIHNNRIENLTVGAAFLAAYGYETDGINIQGQGGFADLIGNKINGVGEGIDIFTSNNRIISNSIFASYIYGIKLVNDPQNNKVALNDIVSTGIAGIGLSVTGNSTKDVSGNIIEGNYISGVDYLNVWSATATACIRTDDAGVSSYDVKFNQFNNNILNPGTYGDYAIALTSSGSNNDAIDNKIQAVGTVGATLNTETNSVITNYSTTERNGILDRSVTAITIANTVTETNIVNVTIPRNTLGTIKKAKCEVNGYFYNNTGSSVNSSFRLRIKLGGTVIYNGITNVLVNSNTRKAPVKIEFDIKNINATNVQKMNGFVIVADTGAGASVGNGAIESDETTSFGPISADGAIDMTSDRALVVSIQLSKTDANLQFVKDDHLITII